MSKVKCSNVKKGMEYVMLITFTFFTFDRSLISGNRIFYQTDQCSFGFGIRNACQ
jgi:hypothetical protein